MNKFQTADQLKNTELGKAVLDKMVETMNEVDDGLTISLGYLRTNIGNPNTKLGVELTDFYLDTIANVNEALAKIEKA